MTERIENGSAGVPSPRISTERCATPRWQQLLGWFGLALAAPLFIWVPLAVATPVPSMIDVFGVLGLRIPASITIAGLLLAAVGFHRF